MAKSVNTTFQILRSILRWAADHYQVDGKPLLESNPVSNLTVLMGTTTEQGQREMTVGRTFARFGADCFECGRSSGWVIWILQVKATV